MFKNWGGGRRCTRLQGSELCAQPATSGCCLPLTTENGVRVTALDGGIADVRYGHFSEHVSEVRGVDMPAGQETAQELQVADAELGVLGILLGLVADPVDLVGGVGVLLLVGDHVPDAFAQALELDRGARLGGEKERRTELVFDEVEHGVVAAVDRDVAAEVLRGVPGAAAKVGCCEEADESEEGEYRQEAGAVHWFSSFCRNCLIANLIVIQVCLFLSFL